MSDSNIFENINSDVKGIGYMIHEVCSCVRGLQILLVVKDYMRYSDYRQFTAVKRI